MRTIALSKVTQTAETNTLFGIQKENIERISEQLQENEELRSERMRAWKAVQKLPKPQRTDEPWRRTDPGRIPFDAVALGNVEDWPPANNLVEGLKETPLSGTLINQPGQQPQIWLDPALKKAGVVFADWSTAVLHHADLLKEFLNTIIPVEEQWFAALTAAAAHRRFNIRSQRSSDQASAAIPSVGTGIWKSLLFPLLDTC